MSFGWNLFVFSPLLAIGVLLLQLFVHERNRKRRVSLAQHSRSGGTETDIEDVDHSGIDTDLEEIDPLLPAVNGEAHEIPDDMEAPAMDNDNLHPVRQRRHPVQRIVGAKKGRSLEIKAQRRAYHEWMQDQAAARKQAEEALTREEEDEIMEKKRARALAEQKIEDARKEERRARQEKLVEEMRRREETILLLQDMIHTKSQFSLEKLSMERKTSIDALKAILKPLLSALPGIAIITEDNRFIRLNENGLHALEVKIKRRGKMSGQEVSDYVEGLLKINL